jgi:site-specific DNA recombinase
MKPAVPKPQRCAIYTRKSSEHNLDLEFNSLDAQREACEAYIKSQAHEGWRLNPDRYDDGGLSGASLDRPALQQLLADVRAGKITVVVVYKVDRLTRSLADFAKLVELFDEHGVSFVSITQSFNTTSSMGRLTLNVLLSFAQFEREVIGERVRDKIAASKRKGLWVGGPVPLGYRCIDKKLEIMPEEAEAVRTIFSLYLELGSMGALLAELDRRGIKTKVNGRRDGQKRGGIRFGVGPLAHLLKNRFYIGEVHYRGEVYRGEHEPILAHDVFDAVQEKFAANAVDRQVRLKGSAALLAGRLFDDRGNRMSPTHANKKGVRYRYYVSQALLQNRQAEAGSIARVPAPEVESLVCDSVRRHFAAMGRAEPATALADRELIERHVERMIVTPQALEVCFKPASEASAQLGDPTLDNPAACNPLTRSRSPGPRQVSLR